MRNKTTITLTTLNGSRSFTIGGSVRATLSYVAIAVLILFTIGGFVIYSLTQELDNFNRLKEQYKTLLQDANGGAKPLDSNESALAENSADAESQSILPFVPFSKKPERSKEELNATEEGDEPIVKRVDTSQISSVERSLMLRLIPSGMPIENRGTTSIFGWRIHPLRYTQREFHTGIDMRATIGTNVYSTADGFVEVTRSTPTTGFGNVITLSHYYGFKTLYAHLNKILVRQGDFVRKGQLIAHSGNSGYSNGPHLHYEVRYLGKPLEPNSFMEWDLKNYDSIFNKEKIVQWDSVVKGVAWQLTLLEQLSLQREPKLQAPSKLSASSISTGK
ncbi:MAG: M23 family metallopeptidase [Helicobacteraceae bacterium]|jgi:murein DD-endopeptidase MepM/ murein hydrolase activator NlpD|nr:M23 family metallopeptidase [Helicobacteraceae bacterium]